MNTINVTKRDLTVKAKKLRRNGYVPGSVFGGMLKEPVALQIEAESGWNSDPCTDKRKISGQLKA